MDIIRLLPDSVANQIAAGEVIQRPASCLKELVENSLDAGATRIQIIIRDAGRTLLQVIDNGRGMSETDARMAFERHATSKITQAKDLFDLHTMGFRGEALASICAVAHVEMTTKPADAQVGTYIEIAGSEVVKQEVCSCPDGTNFKIKDLFYNIPVRRKFLKSNQTELRNLLTEFYRIVLVHPEVQFTFVVDDEILFDLKPQSEKQRIESIFGGKKNVYVEKFVSCNVETELIKIHGFLLVPENATKIAQQYFFVNGRYMRHPYFHKAIMEAYSKMLTPDQTPSYFIYFEVPANAIDVNIHPTKTEIKFENEQEIFQILLATAREALGKFTMVSVMDYENPPVYPTPKNSTPPARPNVIVDTKYNPFQKKEVKEYISLLDENLPQKTMNTPPSEPTELMGKLWDFDDLDINSTFSHLGYIYFPTEKGMLIIDQYRAHVCVLYHQFLLNLTDMPAKSQSLLFPEVIELTPDETILMYNMLPELRDVGFMIEQTNKNEFTIQGIPYVLDASQIENTIKNMLSSWEQKPFSVRDSQQIIALSLAQKVAVERNRILSREEKEEILQMLFNLEENQRTPDGKKVMILLDEQSLANRFN